MLQTTPIPAPRKNLIATTTQNLDFAQAPTKTHPSYLPLNSRFTNNTDLNALLNKFRDIIDNPSVKSRI